MLERRTVGRRDGTAITESATVMVMSFEGFGVCESGESEGVEHAMVNGALWGEEESIGEEASSGLRQAVQNETGTDGVRQARVIRSGVN